MCPRLITRWEIEVFGVCKLSVVVINKIFPNSVHGKESTLGAKMVVVEMLGLGMYCLGLCVLCH